MEDEDATARFLAKYGVVKLAEEWDLAPEVLNTLEKLNIRSFFPVQAVAIPKIMASDSDRVTDICISAPTGSGKTLTYVVPIVQRLLPRVVCRVRALIVLPSRDLAVQVHQIVQQFVKDTPLKCGLAIGQSNFAVEQNALVGDISEAQGSSTMDGGRSLVDILVATPGRLVDHLEQTPGFTLQHLQIMIVDEADRLLNQSYQDWIPKVYASVFNGQEVDDDGLALGVGVTCRRQDSINRRRIRTPLTRVLLSATLTRNPRKLAAIGMSNAELTKIGRIDDPLADNAKQGTAGDSDHDDEDDDASGKKEYSTPTNLDEFWIECDTGSKPLVLLELLSEFAGSLSIVFTASVNSTHRLARLLQLYSTHPERIREFSSSLSQKQRSALVADCKAGRVETVVCSDAMARGMDIDDVANVVNYDVPSFIKTYIHRVGRTARAGRHGRSVTLVKMGQMKGMMRMLKKADNNKLKPYPLQQDHMKTLVPRYTQALQQLKDTLEAEKAGKLQATSILRKTKVSTGEGDKDHDDIDADAEDLYDEVSTADKKRAFSVLNNQLERNLGHRKVRKQ
ncbi:ATP-dependent RNA helicase DDX51 [Phytophthora citrophthora]|uniref:ATP-dependent RNA helicase n=1 Tax=Phytophthora citrophthora TaxID=4793 RepID=A0AAD9H0E4_9STRA|nr:ATP-dependent RNA helicase DDX51 [Phytophthora citrophthora]